MLVPFLLLSMVLFTVLFASLLHIAISERARHQNDRLMMWS